MYAELVTLEGNTVTRDHAIVESVSLEDCHALYHHQMPDNRESAWGLFAVALVTGTFWFACIAS